MFAVILSVIHVLSEEVSHHLKRYNEQLLSFGSGLFIAVIFLVFFPELSKGVPHIGGVGYLLLLLGFSVFHLAEKYIYQHVRSQRELRKDLTELHVTGFFIDSFIIGFAVVLLFDINASVGGLDYIILLPFFFHTISSTISLDQMHKYFEHGWIEKIGLSIAPILGALVATVFEFEVAHYYYAVGFVVGLLLYVVVRDVIPSKGEGYLNFYATGAVLGALLIYIISFL